MSIQFNIDQQPTFCKIEFCLDNGIIQTEDLQNLLPPDAVQNQFAHKGVVLSGRGPVWLYGFLIHYYHPTLWVATHDPRLQAAVVVATHDPSTKVGDLILLEPV